MSFESALLFKHSLLLWRLPCVHTIVAYRWKKMKKKIMKDVTVAFWTHYKFSKAFKVSFSVLMHMAQVVWYEWIVQNWVCMCLCFSASYERINEQTLTTDGSHFRGNMLNIFVVAPRFSVLGMLDHITENENHS